MNLQNKSAKKKVNTTIGTKITNSNNNKSHIIYISLILDHNINRFIVFKQNKDFDCQKVNKLLIFIIKEGQKYILWPNFN